MASVLCLDVPDVGRSAAAATSAGAHVLVIGPRVAGNVPRAVADLAAGADPPRVVVVGPPDPLQVLVTLASGAHAYLPERASPAEVVDAVHAVTHGRAVLPDTLTPPLVDLLRARGRGIVVSSDDGAEIRFTQREWDVLVLHLQARTTAEIAAALYIAPTTVRSHLASIHHKLGTCLLAEEQPD